MTLLDELHASLGDYLSMRAATARRFVMIIYCRWRAPSGRRRRKPCSLIPPPAFIRFHDNHGLLQVRQPSAVENRHRREPEIRGAVNRLVS